MCKFLSLAAAKNLFSRSRASSLSSHFSYYRFQKNNPIISLLTAETRMKKYIRYAKENDREKRERNKGRRRDIEREGEIRERERER